MKSCCWFLFQLPTLVIFESSLNLGFSEKIYKIELITSYYSLPRVKIKRWRQKPFICPHIQIKLYISVPSQMLFVTLQQFGEVGFISLDSAADADFSLVGKSTKPAAVTFDPVNQVCILY